MKTSLVRSRVNWPGSRLMPQTKKKRSKPTPESLLAFRVEVRLSRRIHVTANCRTGESRLQRSGVLVGER
jgi:hypothetical protein